MIRKVFVLLILVCNTVSDEVIRECVRYTFEGYSDESLTNELGCAPGPLWVTGKYSDLTSTINAHERSTTFIKPQRQSAAGSCVSFILTMHGGGTIEVNLYTNNTASTDADGIVVMAYQLNGELLIPKVWNPSNQDFFSGWHTLNLSLPGADKDTYKGYISIMGMASENSIVLVDSFRYIPPGMEPSECELYEDDQSTESSSEETTTVSSTEDQSPESSSEETTTVSSTEDQSSESSSEETTTVSSTEDQSTESSSEGLTTETSTEDQTTESSSEEPTTESSSEGQTTEEVTTPKITTPEPIDNGDNKGFWTPLTITMVVLLSLIVLALICLLFYELGRRRAKAAATRAGIDNDGFDDLPSWFKVPRVKSVYSDVNPLSRSSTYMP